jgi:hypothetical protein
MLHTSYKDQQGCGGSITAPPSLQMLRSRGESSPTPSVEFIFPSGLVEMKLGEFLTLNQGTKTVTQYLHAFNNLCRYAPDMVDTDAKKIASFKRGLGPKMMKHVGTNTRARFNDFISDCLKQEKNNNAYTASKTRKRAFESGPS